MLDSIKRCPSCRGSRESHEAGCPERDRLAKAFADASSAVNNTDRELWRQTPGDYYSDSIHVTKGGDIGINCGGTSIVKPLREWHDLASVELLRELSQDDAPATPNDELVSAIGRLEIAIQDAAQDICDAMRPATPNASPMDYAIAILSLQHQTLGSVDPTIAELHRLAASVVRHEFEKTVPQCVTRRAE